jgi:hypothetical protein
MARFRYACRAALAAVLAWPALTLAQPVVTFAPPKNGTLANLSPVVAPSARCVALSEAHRLLAFGLDRTSEWNGRLSLVRLDEKGKPVATATTWELPCTPDLKKAGTYPLSLAFHPKLPLLYVWQDAQVQLTNPPAPLQPLLREFDHLLVYDVGKGKPELVASLCRGDRYMHGQQGGGLAVDRDGAFLYVPSVHDPKNRSYLKFGRFPLDADGLPDVLGEKDGKLPREPRLKQLAQRNGAGLIPPDVTPWETGYILSWTNAGCGHSFCPLSKDVILAGGSRGVVLWRPGDKDCTLSGLPLRKASNTLLATHPKLPLLFVTAYNSDSLFRVQVPDGYPSLLPEQWVIPDEILLPPAVLGKANKVAVGGRNFVYIISLDEKGRARPEVVRVPVFNPLVRALVYSERFDRLYVSVELSR